jgi:hypothetical protein
MEWNAMGKFIKSLREGIEPQAEATMMKDTGEIVHNCAKHVEHATWGTGNTLAEEHAEPDESGNIAWYDIMFEHGLERAVPTESLNILVSEAHVHAKKKMKEGMEEFAKAQAKKRAAARAAKPNDGNLANNTKPYDKVTHGDVITGRLGKDEMGGKLRKEDLEFTEEVDETIEYRTQFIDVSEADKNYDGYFKAAMKAHGIKPPGELKSDDHKKKFFNKVDAGFKAKNEDVFVEAYMRSDIADRVAAHRKAGNKITDEQHTTKNGEAYHAYVVTEPSGKRTRHIFHGNSRKLETMSAAPKSKLAHETGEDDEDK